METSLRSEDRVQVNRSEGRQV